MMFSAKVVNAPGSKQLAWLDLFKAIALVWIFFNHVAEQLFGYPHIANPAVEWKLQGDRLAQLRPVTGLGLATIPADALLHVGPATRVSNSS